MHEAWVAMTKLKKSKLLIYSAAPFLTSFFKLFFFIETLYLN